MNAPMPYRYVRESCHGQEIHSAERQGKIDFKPDQSPGLDSDFFCESLEGRGKFQ